MDCIESLAKIFFYLAAPSAAWMALFTWKRELKGKSKHEISKQILSLIIQVRANLNVARIRSSFVTSAAKKLAFYQWINEARIEASKLSADVEVHWGGSDNILLNDLCSKLIDLRFVAETYETYVADADEQHRKEMDEFKSVLDGKDTDYNSDLEKLLSQLTDQFKKFVQ